MRIKIVILILFLQPLIMKSQNATATLGNITSCSGESILVPLNVTDFYSVGAMTIYIGYDTNAAEFLSLENINPAIPGGISANAANGQVGIVYTYTEPFDISGEKLFDLSFSYLGDFTSLPFNTGTEIATTDLTLIPLDTFPGSIANSIQLIDQPDSVQSYPDNDVVFGITAQGNINYIWQENAGNGWTNLQNNSTYSGVDTDTLGIKDITADFNGYTYRCVLTDDECTEISDIALLEVASAFPAATLGFVSSCPGNQLLEPLTVADFYNVVEFTFNISFNTTSLLFVDLENIHPALATGSISITLLNDMAGIAINWTGEDPFTIMSDKLFDLKFIYESDWQGITFVEGTYVLNSSSNFINLSLNNGVIQQYDAPVILAQPLDEEVMESDEASFSVEASGAIEYLWMESNNGGNSWFDLTDTPPYYNTHTAVLTINPAYYYLDGHLYACRLSSEHCSVTSSSATLNVDTLTNIQTLDKIGNFTVYPVPCTDKLFINFPAELNHATVEINSVQGQTLYSTTLYNITKENFKLDVSALPVGIFILKVVGNYRGQVFTDQDKILKTR
jgi:hypothetical protein